MWEYWHACLREVGEGTSLAARGKALFTPADIHAAALGPRAPDSAGHGHAASPACRVSAKAARAPKSEGPAAPLHPESSTRNPAKGKRGRRLRPQPSRASQEERWQKGFTPAGPAAKLNKAQILTHSFFTTCHEINLKHLSSEQQSSHWHRQPVAICTRLQEQSRQALAAELSLILSHPCGGSHSPQTRDLGEAQARRAGCSPKQVRPDAVALTNPVR